MKDPYKKFQNTLFFLESFIAWGFRHVTKEIIKILKNNNCKTVLEVCCGTGKLTETMTKKGMEVTGIDMSKTLLDRARKKKRAKRLILQDATKMSFKEEFDVAIVEIALHEMSHAIRKKIFSKMKKAAKEGGILIIADFSLTKNKSISTRINGYFVRKAEESFLKTYPEHYHNYKKFMKNGGIKGFLKGEKIISENYFMGGHLEVIAITK